ncbi:MAG TPA: hypothetical protein PK899_08220, partial [Spirochaetota bacterium]|nr:hypothetical protein [Spirochaetota bacterium]
LHMCQFISGSAAAYSSICVNFLSGSGAYSSICVNLCRGAARWYATHMCQIYFDTYGSNP